MSYTSIIPYNSPLLAANKPIKVPMCTECDEPLLDSKQTVVECLDSYGYHKSQCANCVLMAIDDCCAEISFETIATVSGLLDCKISEDSVHKQESVGSSIRDYLESALSTRVWLDDYTANETQVSATVAEDHASDRLKATVQDRCFSSLVFGTGTTRLDCAPEHRHEHNVHCPDDYHRVNFRPEGPLLDDGLLDFYTHEPEVPTPELSTWEDLTVDQIPDYVDKNQLSTPEPEIEIICNDLG